MRRILAIYVALVTIGIRCGPSPPEPPEPPVCPDGQVWDGGSCVCPEGLEWVEGEGRCLPLRVDVPPDPRAIAGITAFALPLHDRDYIERVCEHVKSQGYNTLRVGFETMRWGDELGRATRRRLAAREALTTDDMGRVLASRGYLPQGPPFDSDENLTNVRRMLDATARCGIWVELIPVFTIKGLGDPDTPEMRRRAVELAVQLVTEVDYKHVFFSYANEWRRSGGVGPKIQDEEVQEGLARLRQTGRLVTTDCFGEHVGDDRWDAKYEKSFLPFVDLVAFHPRRNPEPSEWELSLGVSRYVIREGKLACLYNETVAFATDEELRMFPELQGSFLIANEGLPPEGLRQQIVTDYMDRVRAVDARWYYHCIACFMWKTEFEAFWMPRVAGGG